MGYINSETFYNPSRGQGGVAPPPPPPTVTLTVDSITADNEISLVEAMAGDTIVSGPFTGDAIDGDVVEVTSNGITYDAVVASGVWAISVATSDLLDDPDLTVDAEISITRPGGTATDTVAHAYTVEAAPPPPDGIVFLPENAVLSGSDVDSWSATNTDTSDVGAYTLTPSNAGLTEMAYVADFFGPGLPALHSTSDSYGGNTKFLDFQRNRAFAGYAFVFRGVIDSGTYRWLFTTLESGGLRRAQMSFSNIGTRIAASNGPSSTAIQTTLAPVASNTTHFIALGMDFAAGVYSMYVNKLTPTSTAAISSATNPSENAAMTAWVLNGRTPAGLEPWSSVHYGDIRMTHDKSTFEAFPALLAAKYGLTLAP